MLIGKEARQIVLPNFGFRPGSNGVDQEPLSPVKVNISHKYEVAKYFRFMLPLFLSSITASLCLSLSSWPSSFSSCPRCLLPTLSTGTILYIYTPYLYRWFLYNPRHYYVICNFLLLYLSFYWIIYIYLHVVTLTISLFLLHYIFIAHDTIVLCQSSAIPGFR